MRRILKEAAYAEGGEGGPLFKIHAALGSGAKSLAAASGAMAPLSTTVT